MSNLEDEEIVKFKGLIDRRNQKREMIYQAMEKKR
jgi:hypothetical protein